MARACSFHHRINTMQGSGDCGEALAPGRHDKPWIYLQYPEGKT